MVRVLGPAARGEGTQVTSVPGARHLVLDDVVQQLLLVCGGEPARGTHPATRTGVYPAVTGQTTWEGGRGGGGAQGGDGKTIT